MRMGWMGRVGVCVTLVALGLSGCGDNTAEINQRWDIDPDTKELVGVDQQQELVEVSCCVMLPSGLTNHEVVRAGRMDVGVLLYSRITGEALNDAKISWSIGGSGDASLAAFESHTNVEGLATMTFRAGQAVGAYEVRAEYPGVNPVVFTINVVDFPSGHLTANVINSGSQIAVSPFQVRLYRSSDLSCRFFNPLNVSPGHLADVEAQRDGAQLTFEHLLVGYEYTLAGVGLGPSGQVVAKACLDKIDVFADAVTEVDLVFQMIPLNPVGTYKVRSFFDFGDAIANTGTVGQWLVKIFDGFDNPGKLLYDVIIDYGCGSFLPGLVCDAIDLIGGVTGFRDQLQGYINDLVTSSQTGCNIIRAGCDVRAMIRTLEVLSTLYMSKLGADYRIRGTTSFTGLAFYWRFNCSAGDPPDCGRTEISHDSLLELQLVSGDWEGVLMGYDKLNIMNHGVDLRYGKLINYLINNVLLPAIAGGATNFHAALEYWFNCQGFAQWLSGISLFGYSIGYDSAYSVCSGAIGLLGRLIGFGTAMLSLQEFSSVMFLNGEVKLVENTGDFMVDALEGGTWAGTLNFGDSVSPVRGLWSGCSIDQAVGGCEIPPIDFSSMLGSNVCSACN